MNNNENKTVTKLKTLDGDIYLIIEWKLQGFDLQVIFNEQTWWGQLTPQNISEFTEILGLSFDEYLIRTKNILTKQSPDVIYEIKDGFFTWILKHKELAKLIQGSVKIQLHETEGDIKQGLIDLLIDLNGRVETYKLVNQKLNDEMNKCLKDMAEFMFLKVEMEKALFGKFTELLNSKKRRISFLEESI